MVLPELNKLAEFIPRSPLFAARKPFLSFLPFGSKNWSQGPPNKEFCWLLPFLSHPFPALRFLSRATSSNGDRGGNTSCVAWSWNCFKLRIRLWFVLTFVCASAVMTQPKRKAKITTDTLLVHFISKRFWMLNLWNASFGLLWAWWNLTNSKILSCVTGDSCDLLLQKAS